MLVINVQLVRLTEMFTLEYSRIRIYRLRSHTQYMGIWIFCYTLEVKIVENCCFLHVYSKVVFPFSADCARSLFHQHETILKHLFGLLFSGVRQLSGPKRRARQDWDKSLNSKNMNK